MYENQAFGRGEHEHMLIIECHSMKSWFRCVTKIDHNRNQSHKMKI